MKLESVKKKLNVMIDSRELETYIKSLTVVLKEIKLNPDILKEDTDILGNLLVGFKDVSDDIRDF